AVLIEDKGASVAVHWRLASERDAERAQAAVEAVAAELAGAYRLQLGKAVGEIVPATATKAAAIRTFLETQPYAGRRPVFLGDDRTDEIAFT
ncbi:trehalose-phosphatase, partial [Enterobacter hormaechei]